MNILKQREIFKLGFQIQICQPKKGKNAKIITTNTGSISNKYSIYDQFAHGVPNKKKKKKNKSPLQPTILTANQRIVVSAN